MAHAYERWTPTGWVFDRVAAEKSWEDADVVDGIVFWKSNGHVPDENILRDFRFLGKVFDFEQSLQKRKEQLDLFLAIYRKRMENHVYSQEELSEMRSVYGEGAEVVNVVTGKKVRL